ncbi:hypothetical protein [Pseudomonas cerasi]
MNNFSSMWQLLKKVRYFMETASPRSPEENMFWQECSGIRRSYLALGWLELSISKNV